MSQSRIAEAIAAFLICCGSPVLAQDAAAPRSVTVRANPLWFDGRDDARDFPTNGFFPGDFAASPPWAWLGAAGFLGSNPDRSGPRNSPGVVVRSRADQLSCTRYHRSDNAPYRC